MPTVIFHTILLFCEALWITCLLTLNKLYKWVRLVMPSHAILIPVFGSALNSVEIFWSCDSNVKVKCSFFVENRYSLW